LVFPRTRHGGNDLAEQGLRIATVRDQIVEMLSASLPPSGLPFTRFLASPRHQACGSRRANESQRAAGRHQSSSVSADGFR
jgi:hypothetical protein